MSRLVAFTWGLGLVAATALPLARSPHDDGFPFSTYPMFATPRDKPSLLVAEGIKEDGERVALPPRLVANGSVMQAMYTLHQAQSQGPDALRELCRVIAVRVRKSPPHAGVRRVQIVSSRFDPIAYFEHGPQPEERAVLQRCRVSESS